MNNKKGFTLAELLVVVAIIAVLVAISIPIFSSKIHEAKVATDWANIRAFYAQMKVDEIENGDLNFLADYNKYYDNDSLRITKISNGKGYSLKFIDGYFYTWMVYPPFGDGEKTYYHLYYRCNNLHREHEVEIKYGKLNGNFLDEYRWGSN